MSTDLIVSARAIRNTRLRRGLDRSELAEKVGISHSAMAKLEDGVRQPRGRTLRAIAAALEVSIEDLLEEVPAPEGVA